ncbi:MAG: tRNA (adenosine(37)-N6)-threonylcarbamoyltransferase complex ATPase subunit type 1 TsaE [bacterium]|nr:tRNA (adenosine(37)-N6)-threonylcarbamoyltransferase complex ATPase subunit type 1 TsaE [bacterium]
MPDPADYPWRTVTRAPAATRALGAAAGELLRGGEVILLEGPLGAGKTCFVQGVGEALGVTEEVISPTFTLVNSFPGRLRLHHLDFYRVEPDHDLADIGVPDLLDEVLDGAAVLLVEWPVPLRPELRGIPRLELLALPGPGPDDRAWHLRGEPAPPAAWQTLFAGEATQC